VFSFCHNLWLNLSKLRGFQKASRLYPMLQQHLNGPTFVGHGGLEELPSQSKAEFIMLRLLISFLPCSSDQSSSNCIVGLP
jgi:hypothetical protein